MLEIIFITVNYKRFNSRIGQFSKLFQRAR